MVRLFPSIDSRTLFNGKVPRDHSTNTTQVIHCMVSSHTKAVQLFEHFFKWWSTRPSFFMALSRSLAKKSVPRRAPRFFVASTSVLFRLIPNVTAGTPDVHHPCTLIPRLRSQPREVQEIVEVLHVAPALADGSVRCKVQHLASLSSSTSWHVLQQQQLKHVYPQKDQPEPAFPMSVPHLNQAASEQAVRNYSPETHSQFEPRQQATSCSRRCHHCFERLLCSASCPQL